MSIFDKLTWKFIGWVAKRSPDSAISLMGVGEIPPHVQAMLDRYNAGPYGTRNGKRTKPRL